MRPYPSRKVFRIRVSLAFGSSQKYASSCRDRDHAFNRAVLMDEAERHAAAIREHLRLKIEGFHRQSGGRLKVR